MFWIGIAIIIITFIAIVKKYETRMVLFTSGIVMAAISGQLLAGVDAFSKAMVNGGLVPVICTVMGFAYVMKYTKCDAHMVHLLVGSMASMKVILIPMAVMITFLINIALPSAAGCAAAVGAILIPTMTASGIHPAIAASAIMAGTFGGTLSPGAAHPPFIAKLAEIEVMTVIAGHTMAAVTCGLIGAISLFVIAVIRKEHKGYVPEEDAQDAAEGKGAKEAFRVNYIKAIVPIFPLVLLVLGSNELEVLPLISVPMAMIIGTIVGLIISRSNPQEVSKQFFNGLGHAYGGIIGLIVSAAVFTTGMALIGITGELINIMKGSEQIAMFAAGFGPMIIAILSGSGDAATLAFNGAITPHAANFGYTITDLGSQAFLSGCFGRAMSPVAGAAIVCAQLARVDPIEITKRNAPGMLIAAVVSMIIML